MRHSYHDTRPVIIAVPLRLPTVLTESLRSIALRCKFCIGEIPELISHATEHLKLLSPRTSGGTRVFKIYMNVRNCT